MYMYMYILVCFRSRLHVVGKNVSDAVSVVFVSEGFTNTNVV